MPDRSRRAGAHRIRGRTRALEVAHRLGVALREARRSAGLKQSELADRAGMSQSWVSKMERGQGAPASLATWSATASAVGEQLVAFLESVPGADRPRDFEHLKRQRLIIETAARGGWIARPEAVLDRSRSFARSIDVLLHRPERHEDAVVEVWDYFDDVGAALRVFDAKIAEVERDRATSELEGSAPWRVGGLFVVRGTLRNRQLVSEFGAIFDARFPASSDRWLTALRDPTAAMPNAPGLVWTDIPGSRLFAARRRSAALPDR